MKDERLKALQSAITQIEKDYGKEAVMRLGEKVSKIENDAIPTGALPLDIAIGIGGIPRGRVIEIFGPESSGKSTLAMSIVSQAQKLGGVAAYIDAEHAFDTVYAGKLGVDTDNLLISQPDSGEEGLEITERLIRSGAVDIVVVDSVAALVPRAEIEGEMGDAQMGLQARLMSQALRKLSGTISKTNSVVVFINQIRQKIGVMFGNPETTPGGLALKFYASLRLDIRRVEQIKSGDVSIGNKVVVRVVKNKVAPPFRKAEFEIIFGEGISREGYIIDMGIENNVIEKSGAWITYKGEKIGQGKEQTRKYLKETPSVAAEIEKTIREKLLGNVVVPAAKKEPAQDSKPDSPKKHK